jgi:ABC-2 type transport system permease protein
MKTAKYLRRENKMLSIFKRDLRAMYTTPIGYVFGGIMLIVMYVMFYLTSLSSNIVDMYTLFTFMLSVMVFIIPVLTMRLMSEEQKQKTDQLLLTSPVSVTGIVLGKFLAALATFFITLAGSLLIPIIIFTFSEGASPWYIIGNYLAFIMAASSFISIGLFISSLTENMLVSAILSWAVFLGLLIIDVVTGYIDVRIIQVVLGWMSVFKRFGSFTMGIFDLGDFIYYVSVAIVFLFFTSRVLEKKRYS